MIMIKLTSGSSDWWTVHRSSNGYFRLNLTNAAASTGTPGIASTGAWVNASSTTFSTSQFVSSGESFVAYLFAHDAGGFGTSGTDNVISCGSASVSSSSSVTVNLGYEPQYVLVKGTSFVSSWWVADNMRGLDNTATALLRPNVSGAELNGTQYITPTATGFVIDSGLYGVDGTVIYMAIRRPMKVPTTGTSVFSPNIFTEIVSIPTTLTSNFATDLYFVARRNSATGFYWGDKLRGSTTAANNLLTSASTAAEVTFGSTPTSFASNTGVIINQGFNNSSGAEDILYQFRRAPGFFDEVCYTGTGSAQTINHNLTVVPELLIFKNRVNAGGFGWYTFSPAHLSAPSTTPYWNYLELQSTAAANNWGNNSGITATPTSSTISIGTANSLNISGNTNVLYLFATCPGVSKVGTYTGTGATQTINCGFTAGARFVLIKRTDSTGGWYVWDTARGMVSGTDPSLLLNSTAAEVNANSVFTASTGFQIVSTAADINASGGTFIFLAVS
jgi:hypothetical protein